MKIEHIGFGYKKGFGYLTAKALVVRWHVFRLGSFGIVWTTKLNDKS